MGIVDSTTALCVYGVLHLTYLCNNVLFLIVRDMILIPMKPKHPLENIMNKDCMMGTDVIRTNLLICRPGPKDKYQINVWSALFYNYYAEVLLFPHRHLLLTTLFSTYCPAFSLGSGSDEVPVLCQVTLVDNRDAFNFSEPVSSPVK